jgi:hypothetical protein
MKHPKKLRTLVTMLLAFVAAVSIAEVSHALGPAPDFTGIAEYNPATGVLVVSVSKVKSWTISSESQSMTGPDDVKDVLPLGGGFVTSNIARVGELNFDDAFSYTDIDLGEIAARNLPFGNGIVLLADFAVEDFDVDGGDFLTFQKGIENFYDAEDLANWNAEFGSKVTPIDLVISWTRGDNNDEGKQAVIYLGQSASANLSVVPEPGALGLLALAGLFGLGGRSSGGRRRH